MTNNNQTKRIGDWQQLLMGIGFWILLSALLAQLALVFSENVLGVSLASLSNQNKLKEAWTDQKYHSRLCLLRESDVLCLEFHWLWRPVLFNHE